MVPLSREPAGKALPDTDILPIGSPSNRAHLLRYARHSLLVLAALFVVYGLNIGRLELRQPRIALPSLQQEEASSLSTEISTESEESRYLEPGAAPLTVRGMSGAVPIVESQRQMRTSVTVYEVQPGDAVLGIAQQFGLEGSSLLWANEKLADNPDFLTLGQELNILPVDGAYHTVSQGENLEDIAEEYKVEPEAIAEYPGNDLAAPYALQVGQKLIIPGGEKPYVPRRVFAYNGNVPQGAQKGTGSFVWPMSGLITQIFWEGHRAIDIGAPEGTEIVACDSGYVALAQWSDVGYGRMALIDHGNGYQTLYAHMSAYYVEAGQSVAKGEAIGRCGSTGNATGPHLHLEVIKDDVRRNPFIYLP